MPYKAAVSHLNIFTSKCTAQNRLFFVNKSISSGLTPPSFPTAIQISFISFWFKIFPKLWDFSFLSDKTIPKAFSFWAHSWQAFSKVIGSKTLVSIGEPLCCRAYLMIFSILIFFEPSNANTLLFSVYSLMIG